MTSPGPDPPQPHIPGSSQASYHVAPHRTRRAEAVTRPDFRPFDYVSRARLAVSTSGCRHHDILTSLVLLVLPPLATPRGPVRALVVTSSPARGAHAMYTTFLLAIEAARRSMFITNSYFVPDARMEQALVDAVRRGVRVVVLVPGEIDHNLVRQASRAGFGRLLHAGIEIYEYTRGRRLAARTWTTAPLRSTPS